MTDLLYMTNPELFEGKATIQTRGSSEQSEYIILDKTLFYPQGGGQPFDQGELLINDKISLKVLAVRFEEGEIRHYVDQDSSPYVGKEVVMVVDSKRRHLNSQYHTAAHIISYLVEDEYQDLKAVKGHQFPGEAYVEFLGSVESTEESQKWMQNSLDQATEQKMPVEVEDLDPTKAKEILDSTPYEIPKNKKLRVCTINGIKSVPCGGTHVSSAAKLGKVTITRVKNKKGRTRISYELIS